MSICIAGNDLMKLCYHFTCIEIYELGPAHFLSAPGLGWQAWPKKTGIELELLTDYEKYLIIESRDA